MTVQEQHAPIGGGKTNQLDSYEFEFEEVATSVEERFRRAYNETMGVAKTEGQVEFDSISMGWWLVIKRLGLALWIGKEKPGLETGDLLRIKIEKKPLS